MHVVWFFQDRAVSPIQESAVHPSPQAWSSHDLCFHLDTWDVVIPDEKNDSLKLAGFIISLTTTYLLIECHALSVHVTKSLVFQEEPLNSVTQAGGHVTLS